jgi:hypothetical protein
MNLPKVTLATVLVLGRTTTVEATETEMPKDSTPKENRARTEMAVSLLAAYGAGGRFEDNAVNRYGFGFGARAGATLKSPRIYLGVSFIRFLGGQDPSGKFYTSTLDAEFGYDIRLLRDLLLIRPELGLGVAQPATIQSDNAGYPLDFHWAPGLLVGFRLAPILISAEFRRDMVPDQWSNAATFMFGAGALF